MLGNNVRTTVHNFKRTNLNDGYDDTLETSEWQNVEATNVEKAKIESDERRKRQQNLGPNMYEYNLCCISRNNFLLPEMGRKIQENYITKNCNVFTEWSVQKVWELYWTVLYTCEDMGANVQPPCPSNCKNKNKN